MMYFHRIHFFGLLICFIWQYVCIESVSIYDDEFDVINTIIDDMHMKVRNGYDESQHMKHNNGDYENMLSFYENMENMQSNITDTPEDAYLWVHLGKQYHIGEQYWHRGGGNEKSIKCLDIALKYIAIEITNYPVLYECYLYKGLAYEHIGEIEKSIENFKLAYNYTSTDTEKGLVAQYMGSAYNINNQYKLAIDAYETSIEYNPTDSSSYMGLTAAWLNTKCVRDMKEYVTNHPDETIKSDEILIANDTNIDSNSTNTISAMNSQLQSIYSCARDLRILIDRMERVVEGMNPNIEVDVQSSSFQPYPENEISNQFPSANKRKRSNLLKTFQKLWENDVESGDGDTSRGQVEVDADGLSSLEREDVINGGGYEPSDEIETPIGIKRRGNRKQVQNLNQVHTENMDAASPINKITNQHMDVETCENGHVTSDQDITAGTLWHENEVEFKLRLKKLKYIFRNASPLFYSLFQLADSLNDKALAWKYLTMAHDNDDYFELTKIDDLSLTKTETKMFELMNFFKNGLYPPPSIGLGSNTTVPIFIVGFPRSGSTLLENMLASHENIESIGETSVLHTHIHDLLAKYSNIGDVLHKHSHTHNNSKHDANLTIRQIMAPYTQYTNQKADIIVREMYSRVGKQNKQQHSNISMNDSRVHENMGKLHNVEANEKKTRKRRGASKKKILNTSTKSEMYPHDKAPTKYIIDKMLGNYYNIGIIQLLFPNALILHIYRDPMDTLWSCFQRKFTSAHLSYTSNVRTLVKKYQIYLSLLSHFRQELPYGRFGVESSNNRNPRIVDVSYESIIADPETILRDIIHRHLKLPWDRKVLQHHITRSEVVAYTASMFQVQHATYNTSVGSWMRYSEYLSSNQSIPELNRTTLSMTSLLKDAIQGTFNTMTSYMNTTTKPVSNKTLSEMKVNAAKSYQKKRSVLPIATLSPFTAANTAGTFNYLEQEYEYNWKAFAHFSYAKHLIKERLRLKYNIWDIDLLQHSKGNYPKIKMYPDYPTGAGSSSVSIPTPVMVPISIEVASIILYNIELLVEIEMQEHFSELMEFVHEHCDRRDGSENVRSTSTVTRIRLLDCIEVRYDAMEDASSTSNAYGMSPTPIYIRRNTDNNSKQSIDTVPYVPPTFGLNHSDLPGHILEYLFSLLLVHGRYHIVHQTPKQAIVSYTLCRYLLNNYLRFHLNGSEYLQYESVLLYHEADSFMLSGFLNKAAQLFRSSIDLDNRLLRDSLIGSINSDPKRRKASTLPSSLIAYKAYVGICRDWNNEQLVEHMRHIYPQNVMTNDSAVTPSRENSIPIQNQLKSTVPTDLKIIQSIVQFWKELSVEVLNMTHLIVNSQYQLDAPVKRTSTNGNNSTKRSNVFLINAQLYVEGTLEESFAQIIEDAMASMSKKYSGSRGRTSINKPYNQRKGCVLSAHYVHVSGYWTLFNILDILSLQTERLLALQTNQRGSKEMKNPHGSADNDDSNPYIDVGTIQNASALQAVLCFNSGSLSSEAEILYQKCMADLPHLSKHLAWSYLQMAHSIDMRRLFLNSGGQHVLEAIQQQAYQGINLSNINIVDTSKQLISVYKREQMKIPNYIFTIFRSYAEYYPDCYVQAYARGKRSKKQKMKKTNQNMDSMTDDDNVKQKDRVEEFGVLSTVPIFIVGFYRSGSTLLESLLASHENIVGIGEQSVLASELLTSSEFNILDYHNASDVVLHREKIQEAAHLILNRMQQRAWNIQQRVNFNVTDIPKVNHIVDKSLVNYRNLGWIHLLFPDALIIHIYREETYDVLWSNYKQRFDSNLLSYVNHPQALVEEYVQYYTIMRHFKQTLPKNYILDVPYEQLVEQPTLVLNQIFNRLNVTWDDSILEHAKKYNSYTASLFQIKQNITTSSVGNWKRYRSFLTNYSNTNAGVSSRAATIATRGVKRRNNLVLEMEKYIDVLSEGQIYPFSPAPVRTQSQSNAEKASQIRIGASKILSDEKQRLLLQEDEDEDEK